MTTIYDAVIVGAGPAGLACSTTLAANGLEVAVLDEQAAPGGQIYRNISRSSAGQQAVLGDDYIYGLKLLRAFEDASLTYLPQSRVWQADSNGDVCFSRYGTSQKINGRFLVLCTGAMERPVPFPGWTLPGVMTCGGMSNLYKDSGLVPSEPLVLAGSGPLLWLVAEHLLTLDAPIKAIFDTAPMTHVFAALKEAPAAVRRADFLLKGVKMIADVYLTARKKKIKIYRNVSGLRGEGNEKLQTVRATVGGRQLSIDATTLLVTEGIIPNTSLLRQVGCTHEWNPVQRFWYPRTNANGNSNFSKVFVAGDGAFVHGAKSAEYKGQLAGLTIARELHRLSSDEYQQQSEPVRQELKQDLFPRPFIDALYRPGKTLFSLADSTIVCRCEGVTAGRIRELVKTGHTDHNEIKAIIRCGMGPCQGRMCSSAVHELIVEGSGIAPEKARQHRLRPPIKPVNLLELANAKLEGTDEI